MWIIQALPYHKRQHKAMGYWHNSAQRRKKNKKNNKEQYQQHFLILTAVEVRIRQVVKTLKMMSFTLFGIPTWTIDFSRLIMLLLPAATASSRQMTIFCCTI